MSKKKISLIILGLNEHDGIDLLKERINNQKKFLEEIIYIDGGSSDGSINLAKLSGWKTIVQDEKKRGALNAIKLGIETSKGDYIILFSPDNNCIPEKIQEVVNKINDGWEFVKVSRYYKNAKSYDDNLVTGFGNKLFNFFILIFYGFKTTDALGIYYGVKKKLFQKLKINFKNTAINTELMIKCKIFKIKCIDIEGDELKRVGGESKRPIILHGINEMLTILKFIILNLTKKL
jgi:glycosyltransferase involved in cell wall biosynthesis